ncbi:hypothetical protein EMIT0111MI5_460003 [Burkholderia sp. IT-111MI5]
MVALPLKSWVPKRGRRNGILSNNQLRSVTYERPYNTAHTEQRKCAPARSTLGLIQGRHQARCADPAPGKFKAVAFS